MLTMRNMVNDEKRRRKTTEIRMNGSLKNIRSYKNPDDGKFERRKNSDITQLFNRPNVQNVLIFCQRIEWAVGMHGEQNEIS